MQAELTVAENPDIMSSTSLTPAQEAREVIETETRCYQATTPEPAFLIAMRSVLAPQRLVAPAWLQARHTMLGRCRDTTILRVLAPLV